MILHWRDREMECYKAVRDETEVFLYDENFKLIDRIFNITENEWNFIYLQNGEWSDASEIPSMGDKIEKLEADTDYLLMMIGE